MIQSLDRSALALCNQLTYLHSEHGVYTCGLLVSSLHLSLPLPSPHPHAGESWLFDFNVPLTAWDTDEGGWPIMYASSLELLAASFDSLPGAIVNFQIVRQKTSLRPTRAIAIV